MGRRLRTQGAGAERAAHSPQRPRAPVVSCACAGPLRGRRCAKRAAGEGPAGECACADLPRAPGRWGRGLRWRARARTCRWGRGLRWRARARARACRRAERGARPGADRAALGDADVQPPAPPAPPPDPGWPPRPRSAPSLRGRPDGTDRGWFELVRLHDDTRGAISSGGPARRALSVPSASAPAPPRAGPAVLRGRERGAGRLPGGRRTGAAGGPARAAAASPSPAPWGRREGPALQGISTAARRGHPSSTGQGVPGALPLKSWQQFLKFHLSFPFC